MRVRLAFGKKFDSTHSSSYDSLLSHLVNDIYDHQRISLALFFVDFYYRFTV